MEIPEESRNAGHQFHRGRGDSPRHHGAMRCPHAEAHDQRILRRVVQERQRHGRHHLGNRGEYRHPNTIDQQAFVPALTIGNDRCRTVAQQIASREIPVKAPGGEPQHQGRPSNGIGGESARSQTSSYRMLQKPDRKKNSKYHPIAWPGRDTRDTPASDGPRSSLMPDSNVSVIGCPEIA